MERINIITTFSFLLFVCLFVFLYGSEALPLALNSFVVGIIIIIGAIYFTKEFLKTEKIIFDIESLPILETDEAVEGVPFAGEGVVEPEEGKILYSPYTNTPCVYFHSIKEIQVRTGKSSYWKIVDNLVSFIPFYIKDKRGKLKVDLTNLDDDFSKYEILLKDRTIPNPKNSEIDPLPVLKQKMRYSSEFTPNAGILDLFFPNYRFSEFVLPPHTKVFVCGMVSRKNGELVLRESEKIPLIISRKSRDQYVEEFYRGSNLVYFSHFLSALGFTISVLGISRYFNIAGSIISLLLFFGNFIILGSSVFSLYNRVVTLKNRALNALSNIEAELKRRADLIPNIVEIVKEYAEHESTILKIIAESRAKIFFSKEPKEEAKPIINSLVAVIENYPELKASEQFQSLMKILIDTEERIAFSREFYNRTVRKYNTLISQFPFLIVAKVLNLKEMEFITIARGE